MNIYVELLIISLIICFVIDFSGFIEEMEAIIKRMLKIPFFHIPKPFSCTLCCTWWVGLIYLLCVGEFSIVNIGYVSILAGLSRVFADFMFAVIDILSKIVAEIHKLAD